MNNINNQYEILWLNGELKVDTSNPNYLLLNQVKKIAENKYPGISIQACITGEDFIEFAKRKKWDAFVLDYNGFMSEESDKQFIITKLVKKIQSIEKNRDALRLCATMEPPITDEFDDMIEHLGLSKNPNTNKWFFVINEDLNHSLQVFDTIKIGLDNDWRLFNGYYEIKTLYDSTNILSGKNAIKDLLLWKQNRDYVILQNAKFESGIRDVLEEIYMRLLRIGFYNNSSKNGNFNNDVKPPMSFARYINGSVQDKNNPKNYIYYLNTSCRFAWEAVAMSFLDSFQNAAHHKNTYGQPSVNDVSFSYYYDSFIQMVFDSLVIFSKWYVRFMKDYQNCQNITKYFNNIKW